MVLAGTVWTGQRVLAGAWGVPGSRHEVSGRLGLRASIIVFKSITSCIPLLQLVLVGLPVLFNCSFIFPPSVFSFYF